MRSVLNVTFRQLRTFLEVARRRSVARAAEAMHLTPPAVSMQLRALEREVGLQLFERTGRRMVPTPAGERLQVHARRLVDALVETENDMARAGGAHGGRLTVAMVNSAKYFLPQLLARFHVEHPEVDVRLRLGGRDRIDEMLAQDEADLCVTGRPPRRVPLEVHAFAPHPHVLIMSPSHPLASAAHVSASALGSQPFIVREPGSGTRTALQEYLERHDLRPDFVMEMASNEAIKQAVMANLGVSLVSKHILALEWTHGLIASPSVEGLPLMRTWHIAHPTTRTLSPAAEALRDFIVEHGETHLEAMFDGGAH